jgi:ferritin-like protein
MAEEQKRPGGRFQPGQSGNPKGKRPGTRNRVTLLAEQMMGNDAEAVIRSVIDAAKAGDMQAARMVLERIAPLPKDRPVAFKIPAISTAAEVAAATEAVLAAVASGELTPAEGSIVAGILETRRKAIETAELAEHVEAIEAARGGQR